VSKPRIPSLFQSRSTEGLVPCNRHCKVVGVLPVGRSFPYRVRFVPERRFDVAHEHDRGLGGATRFAAVSEEQLDTGSTYLHIVNRLSKTVLECAGSEALALRFDLGIEADGKGLGRECTRLCSIREALHHHLVPAAGVALELGIHEPA
jgi:hypothetical protein